MKQKLQLSTHLHPQGSSWEAGVMALTLITKSLSLVSLRLCNTLLKIKMPMGGAKGY